VSGAKRLSLEILVRRLYRWHGPHTRRRLKGQWSGQRWGLDWPGELPCRFDPERWPDHSSRL